MNTPVARKLMYLLVSLVVVLQLAPPIAAEPTDLQALRQTSSAFSAVAKEAIPAVVFIKVEKTVKAGSAAAPGMPFDPFGDDFFERFFRHRLPGGPQQFRQVGQGSGFIISQDGYILTNHHVAGDSEKITVKLHDGREFEAKVIGTDEKSDIALIKIKAKNLPVLPLGDSDKVEIGHWAIAIGNPFGLAETLTVGVVSAKGRSNVHIADYEDFIQTDAAINPGNSGGPLLNLDGQAIGINTAIFSRSGGYMGIGFAIPINMAKNIKEQLLKSGKVTRGQLGVLVQEITQDLADSFGLSTTKGVLIAQVFSGSPAEKAGLKTGDIVLKMNGQEIKDIGSFRNAVALSPPGTKLDLLVSRDGKARDIVVEIGELSEHAPQVAVSGLSEKLGIEVQNLTKETARLYGGKVGEGVIVSRVARYSPAARAGIEPGALILTVNRHKVSSVSEFNQALQESAKTKKVLLLLKQRQYTQFVVLSLD